MAASAVLRVHLHRFNLLLSKRVGTYIICKIIVIKKLFMQKSFKKESVQMINLCLRVQPNNKINTCWFGYCSFCCWWMDLDEIEETWLEGGNYFQQAKQRAAGKTCQHKMPIILPINCKYLGILIAMMIFWL